MSNPYLIFILFNLLGLAGNVLNIEMFFGVNQIFGSIFVLLTVWYFGPFIGLLSAIIVHSYTIYLWGHPYAFIGFIFEAFVVGLLLRWRISNIFIADTLYWLFLGVWLVPLFYGQIMQLPQTQVELIMLKQPANGIFNALIATLLSFVLIRFLPNQAKVTLQNLLFTLIMFCVSLALYLSANLLSNNSFEQYRQNAIKSIQAHQNDIETILSEYVQQSLLDHYQFLQARESGSTIQVDENTLAVWQVKDGKQTFIYQQKGSSESLIKPVNSVNCNGEYSLFASEAGIYILFWKQQSCYLVLQSHQKLQNYLQTYQQKSGIESYIYSRHQLLISGYPNHLDGNDEFVKINTYLKQRIDKKTELHYLPDDNLPKMKKWAQSKVLHIFTLPFFVEGGQFMIATPFKPYIDSLQKIYIYTFIVMLTIIVLVGLLSLFISNKMSLHLTKLTRMTLDLPEKLRQHQKIRWPDSFLSELSLLIENIKTVSNKLSRHFYDSEERYLNLFRSASDAILVVQTDNNCIMDFNPLARDLLQLKDEEKSCRFMQEFFPSSDHKLFYTPSSELGQQVFQLKLSGKTIPVRINSQYLNYQDQNVHLICIKDIREELKSKQQIDLMATVFETTSEGIMITDEHTRIIMVNKGFEQITGYSQSEILGQTPKALDSGWQNKEFYDLLWKSINDNGSWQGEIWNRRKNGDLYAEWLTIYKVTDQQKVLNYIGVFNDITENKKNLEKINQLAYYDVLTGLPNRQLFEDRIQHALENAKRNKTALALLFFDLDNFKNINDTMGHQAGDNLLKQVSQRVTSSIRSVDTFCRLGGDEFTLILEDFKDKSYILTCTEKIILKLKEPFYLDDNEAYTSVSIGASLYPEDADSVGLLMQYADTAMYRVKEKGKKGLEFYTSEMNEKAMRQLEVENGLRRAIKENYLSMNYQPQMSLTTNKITGVEALLRWNDPDKGFISPAVFIPIAEKSNLMIDIERWVIRECISQQVKWRSKGIDINLSLNISDQGFHTDDFVDYLLQSVKESGLPCDCFELELTERIMMDGRLGPEKISALKEAGFHLSLDDFGTGQSSLSYLKKYSIDKLKIDKSFVDDIPHDEQSCEIANAIISLSKAMKMDTVAEGIEIECQSDFFKQLGCDSFQGYLFSKPLPAEQIEPLLKQIKDFVKNTNS